ncbi:hypothetical protein GCM10022378_08470 [Salinicoccus jeotgali]|uniref:AAA+ ATPase domain-containing protein n=1 Tax=Salinicoccus jeotgali TaxID=381634 RepID=A0ABP7ERJ2_9STAP
MNNYQDKNFFFVGTTISEVDYTDEFINNNKWQLGWEGNEEEPQYKTMRTYYDQMSEGDYIVLKSTYTRKHDLPFFNPNNVHTSVMSIKAVGIIKNNLGDGHTVEVDWLKDYRNTKKEWLFYTQRQAIWMIDYKDYWNSLLIEFAINDVEQDYSVFLHDEYWRDKYFTEAQYEEYKNSHENNMYDWIDFYHSFADKLRNYVNDRKTLIEKIKRTYDEIGMKLPRLEREYDLTDIDPFTIFGLFNKGITDKNRIKIINGFKETFSIEQPTPKSFAGVPVVVNMAATFYYFKGDREDGDIDNLWQVFIAALDYDQDPTETHKEAFIQAFDTVTNQQGIKWNITMGLYWIRPYAFINLDSVNRDFIAHSKNISTEFNKKFSTLKKVPTGNEYIDIIKTAQDSFESGNYKYRSFPELSLHAWLSLSESDEEAVVSAEVPHTKAADIPKSEYAEKLISAKNVILRGAPGTGKTYLARNIAAEIASGGETLSYKSLDQNHQHNIEFIQFHPSYDYTDFVEGYRPTIDAKTGEMHYEIIPGVFKKFIKKAIVGKNSGEKFVLIIDEINRGEISKIFGELFFAIDPGYRGEEGKVKTQYSSINAVDDFLYVPENLYIIGTMNDIDRSVESFDFAMRRRFRFIEITAETQADMLIDNLTDHENAIKHMHRLNDAISEVEGLNSHYHIGPSYFLKLKDINYDYGLLWQDYLEPLLEEYVRGFFDEQSILSDLKAAYDGDHVEYDYEN